LIALVFSDFAGQTIAIEGENGSTADIATVAGRVSDMIQRLQALQKSQRSMAGLGLAVSGSFVSDDVFNTPYGMDAWADMDLERHYSERPCLPPFAENDGTASALAECMLGAGRAFRALHISSSEQASGGGGLFWTDGSGVDNMVDAMSAATSIKSDSSSFCGSSAASLRIVEIRARFLHLITSRLDPDAKILPSVKALHAFQGHSSPDHQHSRLR
jgi:hypothetical protein